MIALWAQRFDADNSYRDAGTLCRTTDYKYNYFEVFTKVLPSFLLAISRAKFAQTTTRLQFLRRHFFGNFINFLQTLSGDVNDYKYCKKSFWRGKVVWWRSLTIEIKNRSFAESLHNRKLQTVTSPELLLYRHKNHMNNLMLKDFWSIDGHTMSRKKHKNKSRRGAN